MAKPARMRPFAGRDSDGASGRIGLRIAGGSLYIPAVTHSIRLVCCMPAWSRGWAAAHLFCCGDGFPTALDAGECRRWMTQADQVRAIVAPSLESMGYRARARQLIGGGSRPTLQIMAERRDGAAMTVEDCADISRARLGPARRRGPDRRRLYAGSQLARHRPAADPAARTSSASPASRRGSRRERRSTAASASAARSPASTDERSLLAESARRTTVAVPLRRDRERQAGPDRRADRSRGRAKPAARRRA